MDSIVTFVWVSDEGRGCQERCEAEGSACFETEEAVRTAGRQLETAELQHGTGTLHHADSQGHQDNCCCHENRHEPNEKGV